MDLRQLQTFCTVVETGGFRRAAERLYLAQSAVSTQIRQLEQEFGTPLLERSSRGVTLTQAGHVLHRYGQTILGLSQEARERIGALDRQGIAEVRVGTTDIGAFYLPAILRTFRSAHPGVAVALHEDTSAVLVDRVMRGELDLALVAASGGTEDCTFTELFELQLLVVCSAADPLARGSKVTVAELATQPLVVYEPGCAYRHIIETVCRANGISPVIALESNRLGPIRDAVAAGMGVTILPEAAVRRDIEEGSLVARRLEGLNAAVSMALVSRRAPSTTPPIDALVEILTSRSALGLFPTGSG